MDWIPNALKEVREKKPLVQNITNFVVMNTTANALLTLGASPVMAHAMEELEDMLMIADSLVINIGTLDEHWISSVKEAVKIADDLNKPVVFDPVGAGVTKFRTEVALNLIETGNIDVVRGNFGEIAALLGEYGKTRGVDSVGYNVSKAEELVCKAAEKFDTVVAVTGPIDHVSDGNNTYAIYNGHEMLGRVTGTGCMVTTIIGAFLSVEKPLKATVSALTTFGIVAEKAYEESKYPGSFHTKLYDWLYRINEKTITEKMKVIMVES